MNRHLQTLLRGVAYMATPLVLALMAWAISLVTDSATPGLLLLGNTFATPDWVMRKMARRLTNNCAFAGLVMRDYDDSYKQQGVKMGDTITLRLPQRFRPTVGAVMVPTPLNDQTVSLTITDQTNVGFEYGSWAATLEVDDYMNRYGNAGVDTLVNNIDFTGLGHCYKKTAKSVGVPGVVSATNAIYTLAKTKLVEAAIPRPYKAVLTADMHGQIAAANVTLFNPGPQIAMYFRKGQFGAMALGIEEWHEDENVVTHQVGALGTTPVVDGAGQVQDILVSGASASIAEYWRQGDVIQFATVYDINTMNYQNTRRLKDFAVQDTVASTAGGAVTVRITPGIVASGPFQNCTGSPAAGDAITTFGHASTYAAQYARQGLVFHKEAYALVMADLELPQGLWVSERISNKKLGISIRMLKDHDIINDVSPARLDTAHGWEAIRQEMGCRVQG